MVGSQVEKFRLGSLLTQFLQSRRMYKLREGGSLKCMCERGRGVNRGVLLEFLDQWTEAVGKLQYLGSYRCDRRFVLNVAALLVDE